MSNNSQVNVCCRRWSLLREGHARRSSTRHNCSVVVAVVLVTVAVAVAVVAIAVVVAVIAVAVAIVVVSVAAAVVVAAVASIMTNVAKGSEARANAGADAANAKVTGSETNSGTDAVAAGVDARAEAADAAEGMVVRVAVSTVSETVVVLVVVSLTSVALLLGAVQVVEVVAGEAALEATETTEALEEIVEVDESIIVDGSGGGRLGVRVRDVVTTVVVTLVAGLLLLFGHDVALVLVLRLVDGGDRVGEGQPLVLGVGESHFFFLALAVNANAEEVLNLLGDEGERGLDERFLVATEIVVLEELLLLLGHVLGEPVVGQEDGRELGRGVISDGLPGIGAGEEGADLGSEGQNLVLDGSTANTLSLLHKLVTFEELKFFRGSLNALVGRSGELGEATPEVTVVPVGVLEREGCLLHEPAHG